MCSLDQLVWVSLMILLLSLSSTCKVINNKVKSQSFRYEPKRPLSPHILDIIPDVERDHIKMLVTDTIETYRLGTVECMLLILFNDPKYPNVRKESKGKEGLDITSTLERADDGFHYGDHNRPFTGGPNYTMLTLVHQFHFH